MQWTCNVIMQMFGLDLVNHPIVSLENTYIYVYGYTCTHIYRERYMQMLGLELVNHPIVFLVGGIFPLSGSMHSLSAVRVHQHLI